MEYLKNVWYALTDGAAMWLFIFGFFFVGLYLDNEDSVLLIGTALVVGGVKVIHSLADGYKQLKK